MAEQTFDHLPNMAVRETFEVLRKKLDQLIAALATQSADYACWVAAPSEQAARSCRENVLWIYGQLFYEKNQDKRDTLYRPGFLATSSDTLALAREVNTAKVKFRDAMLAIKKQPRKQASMALFQEHFESRHPAQAKALHSAGLACVHLKQAYRLIPVLPETPRRIGFSWCTDSKVIKRVSHSEAVRFVEYCGGGELAMQRLDALPDDSAFAQVRKHPAHVRANMSYAQSRSAPIPASLPILFAVDQPSYVPLFQKVTYQPAVEGRNRLPRNDKRVDYENPIIESAEKQTGLYPYKQ